MVGGTETQRTVYYSAGGAFRIVGGSNAGLYYRHTDHLGSTSVLSNASGQKVANSEVVFAPFGEIRTGSLPSLTDFGYTGQRHDGSTGGLMYYGARYYLPSLRRFISPDTLIPDPSNTQDFNRYAYALNNPIRYIDPTGHAACIKGAACRRTSGGTPSESSDSIHMSGGGLGSGGPATGFDPTTKLGKLMGARNSSLADILAVIALHNELLSYGVDVDWDPNITFSAMRQALEQIRAAVLALADAAAGAINAYLGQFGTTYSATEAFAMLFGPTHIYVEPNQYETAGPGYAQNCGWGAGSSSTCDHAVQGGGYWEIEVSLVELLGGGTPGMNGVGLIAHEIAHNVTWADGGSTPHGLYSNTEVPVGSNSFLLSSTMSVQPGNHGGWGRDEFTADVIANWALNAWTGDYSSEAAGFANQWMLDNIGTFLSNMACVTSGPSSGGSAYGCAN